MTQQENIDPASDTEQYLAAARHLAAENIAVATELRLGRLILWAVDRGSSIPESAISNATVAYSIIDPRGKTSALLMFSDGQAAFVSAPYGSSALFMQTFGRDPDDKPLVIKAEDPTEAQDTLLGCQWGTDGSKTKFVESDAEELAAKQLVERAVSVRWQERQEAKLKYSVSWALHHALTDKQD